MSEQSSLLRQWVLLRTLSARHSGASVKELAEELTVCEKTVRRDLDTFKQAGFPVEETVGQHGLKRWRLDPAKTQPGLSFAFDEAVALYLGRRFLDPLAGTVFWDAAQRAFRKVRAMLSAQALKIPRTLRRRLPSHARRCQRLLEKGRADRPARHGHGRPPHHAHHLPVAASHGINRPTIYTPSA